MAKVTGPLMSLDASGSVAGTMTFSKWKGRNYVRQTVTPSNPKSPAQTAFRIMFGFLSEAWKLLSPTDQGSWDALGKQLNASPFNGYMRQNQRDWTQTLTPSVNSVPAATTGPTTLTARTATGGVRQIVLAWNAAAIQDNWGVIIHRSLTTGFSPDKSNAIGVVLYEVATPGQFIDSNLTPETYFYRFSMFSHAQEEAIDGTEVSATAT
jgi:hypothetical protein